GHNVRERWGNPSKKKGKEKSRRKRKRRKKGIFMYFSSNIWEFPAVKRTVLQPEECPEGQSHKVNHRITRMHPNPLGSVKCNKKEKVNFLLDMWRVSDGVSESRDDHIIALLLNHRYQISRHLSHWD